MENLEEKLNAILKDPQMMQQVMALAQSLGNPSPESSQGSSQAGGVVPGPELSVLRSLSGLAGSGTIDRDQKQLLQALSPYLSSDRVSRLENAMRAAKLAKLASAFLSSGGMQMLSGR